MHHVSDIDARGADAGALDALLGSYAAGGLDPHLHALVASHLIISPVNRAFVAALEAVRGKDIEGIAPVELGEIGRAHV